MGEVLPEPPEGFLPPPERFPRFPPLRPGDHQARDGDATAAGGDEWSAGGDEWTAGGEQWTPGGDGRGPGGDETTAGGGDQALDGAGPVVRQDRWVIAVAQPAAGEGAQPPGDRESGDRLDVRPVRFRGVARVPSRPVSEAQDTGELAPSQWGPSPPPARVSRYRWRTLRRGARWTVTGAGFAVICWGLWAVTTRDGGMVNRILALAVVLATAGLVFSVSRLLGRVVLENTLGRTRRSAWVSHLLTFLLLVAAGVTFLQQTWWAVEAWQWLDGQLR